MYDAGKILVGILVFLAIATSPIWLQRARGSESAQLELKLPTNSTKCVEPTAYMRAYHMDMLSRWRDEAVRDGDRVFIGLDGKKYDKSLTGTCIMSCHSDRAQFCDRCHEYAAVEPPCWNCHVHRGIESTAAAERVDRVDREAGVTKRRAGRRAG